MGTQEVDRGAHRGPCRRSRGRPDVGDPSRQPTGPPAAMGTRHRQRRIFLLGVPIGPGRHRARGRLGDDGLPRRVRRDVARGVGRNRPPADQVTGLAGQAGRGGGVDHDARAGDRQRGRVDVTVRARRVRAGAGQSAACDHGVRGIEQARGKRPGIRPAQAASGVRHAPTHVRDHLGRPSQAEFGLAAGESAHRHPALGGGRLAGVTVPRGVVLREDAVDGGGHGPRSGAARGVDQSAEESLVATSRARECAAQ